MLVLVIVGVTCAIVHHHARVPVIVHTLVLLLILGLVERLLLRLLLLLLLLLLLHLILRLSLIELSLLRILVLHRSHNDIIVPSLASIVAIVDSNQAHICSVGLLITELLLPLLLQFLLPAPDLLLADLCAANVVSRCDKLRWQVLRLQTLLETLNLLDLLRLSQKLRFLAIQKSLSVNTWLIYFFSN